MIKKARMRVLFAAAAIFSFPAAANAVQKSPASEPQRIEQLMARAKAADNTCPGGCGLVATLEKHGIKPRLVSSEQLDVLVPGLGAQIVGRQQGNMMLLNGAFDDAKLLETVAHETRHVWQKKEAGAMVAGMSPRQALLLSRYREADAFAYAVYFTYQYEKATGKKLVNVPANPFHIGRLPPSQQMYALFKFDMDSGMSLPTAYRFLLNRTFRHVNELDYDGDMLAALEKAPLPGLKMEDAAFAAILRRMGGPDFGKTTGVFSTWTDAELVSLDKTGGITPENLTRLEKLETLKPPVLKPPAP